MSQVTLDVLAPKKETRRWKCEYRHYGPRCADGDISAGPAPGHWAEAGGVMMGIVWS